MIFLATTAEYKLLESMNLVTKEKYEEMTSHAGSLVNNMKALQEKCTNPIVYWKQRGKMVEAYF